MNKTRKLKAGNENGVIIAILAVLLIIVAAIVGVVLAKDNKAVAKFDGGKVTRKEYEVYYEMFSNYLSAYGYDAESIPTEILYKAAQDKIILTDAKAAKTKLTDEQKKEIEETFSNEEYVKYFKNNYSFSIDALKDIYYNDYLIQAYLENQAKAATAEEITEYIKSQATDSENLDMNEYDTSHILFSFTKEDGTAMSDEEKATLKTKAEEVLKKALAGEDFATLAHDNSDDTGTKENGGQYKLYDDGNTVTEYETAVKSMKAGEIKAELVETSYGYHIIKLNAINENGRTNSETAREAYAQSKYTNATEDRHLTFDETKFKEYVKSIDPNAYTTTDSTSNGSNSNVQVTTDAQ